ncbi:hypothetical protein GWI33_005256 [Rhynchophorus ferrugineus]|uniref:Uncharacterized protein n=1 Tax=Rhynchophorus ferrugineus TaxID=354439 RepID=A0A834IHP8_RHYFE|nr:hypothetical protein GWI33_005256 [Rhynchophorus ferrugineus]
MHRVKSDAPLVVASISQAPSPRPVLHLIFHGFFSFGSSESGFVTGRFNVAAAAKGPTDRFLFLLCCWVLENERRRSGISSRTEWNGIDDDGNRLKRRPKHKLNKKLPSLFIVDDIHKQNRWDYYWKIIDSLALILDEVAAASRKVKTGPPGEQTAVVDTENPRVPLCLHCVLSGREGLTQSCRCSHRAAGLPTWCLQGNRGNSQWSSEERESTSRGSELKGNKRR